MSLCFQSIVFSCYRVSWFFPSRRLFPCAQTRSLLQYLITVTLTHYTTYRCPIIAHVHQIHRKYYYPSWFMRFSNFLSSGSKFLLYACSVFDANLETQGRKALLTSGLSMYIISMLRNDTLRYVRRAIQKSWFFFQTSELDLEIIAVGIPGNS